MAITKEQTAFISKVASLITDTRILKSVTIAQAILESGWGQSGLTIKGNALFGIKAGLTWKGKAINSKTFECYDKIKLTTISASFRAYNSWTESIADHTNFIVSNSRYKAVLIAKDYKTACYEIAQAGYATAPNYALKLINIIEQYKLYTYDKPVVTPAVKPIVPVSKPAPITTKPIVIKLKVKAGTYYVRSKASILGKIITSVKPNTPLTSSKYVKGWYYIDALKGYIGEKAVNKI